jgi:hypothetical protein
MQKAMTWAKVAVSDRHFGAATTQQQVPTGAHPTYNNSNDNCEISNHVNHSMTAAKVTALTILSNRNKNKPVLYHGRHRPIPVILIFFLAFFSRSRHVSGWHLKLGDDRFLPHSFPVAVYEPS